MTDAPDEKYSDDPTSDMEVDFLINDLLDEGTGPDTLETDHMPTARIHRRLNPKRQFARLRQKKALREIMPRIPQPGQSVHAVGPGQYDFFTFLPEILSMIGHADRVTASTWTINHPNTIELFELWDAGRIGTVDFLTGDYFKRRDTAIYTMLVNGLRARGGRYRAFKNHSKLMMIENPARDAYITIVGSANLTANPRLEIYVITNDRPLYDFHREWVEEVLTK